MRRFSFFSIFILFSMAFRAHGALNNYTRQSCSCGRRNTNRIIGGEETGVGEYPWRAYHQNSGCGATIISRNWAMTAAHCIRDPNSGNHWIRVGDHNKQTENEARSDRVQIARVITHPRYRQDGGYSNDITLLQFRSPINFRYNVNQVCLPFRENEQTFDNERVIASGWGSTTGNRNDQSPVLRDVELTVTTKRCSRRPGNMCTHDTQRKNICYGDSGGSIDWMDENGNYKAIGIMSTTGDRDCGNTYESFGEIIWRSLDGVFQTIDGYTSIPPKFVSTQFKI